MASVPGISVEHIPAVTNDRSRLASAILGCVQFVGSFTDIMIKQGERIKLSSAGGNCYMPEGLPHSNLIVTEADFQHFFSSMFGDTATNRVGKYWDTKVLPKLQALESFNASVSFMDGQYHLRFALYLFNRGSLGMHVRVAQMPKKLDDLGLASPLVDRIKTNPAGLLLVTGPTASGKTSTAYSILDHFGGKSNAKIVTIEDPVEFPLVNMKAEVFQREVGVDVCDFGTGLVDAMRMSPTVMLCGEVREKHAAEMAIAGGESGALMIVTTHCHTITGALRKLLAFSADQTGAHREILAGSLIGVVRQLLVPRRDETGYVMVSDTLFLSKKVRDYLAEGNWYGLDTLTNQVTNDTTDFVSMAGQIEHLVKEDVVNKEDIPFFRSSPAESQLA